MLQLPSVDDLRQLSLRPTVAYAARSATRVNSMYRASDQLSAQERAKHKQAIYDAIAIGHEFAADRIEAMSYIIDSIEKRMRIDNTHARRVGVIPAFAKVNLAFLEAKLAASAAVTPITDKQFDSAKKSGDRNAIVEAAINAGGAAKAAESAVHAADTTRGICSFLVKLCTIGSVEKVPDEVFKSAASAAAASLDAQIAGTVAARFDKDQSAAARDALVVQTRRDYDRLVALSTNTSSVIGVAITDQLSLSVWS